MIQAKITAEYESHYKVTVTASDDPNFLVGAYTVSKRNKRTLKRLGITFPPETPKELPKLPGLVEQAKNFGKAAIRHAKKGFPPASDEVIQERFKICVSNHCGQFLPDKRNPEKKGRCALCGCFLINNRATFKNKLQWAEESCPRNYWFPVSPGEKKDG